MHQMGHAAGKHCNRHACKADEKACEQDTRMVDAREEKDDVYNKNESGVG